MTIDMCNLTSDIFSSILSKLRRKTRLRTSSHMLMVREVRNNGKRREPDRVEQIVHNRWLHLLLSSVLRHADIIRGKTGYLIFRL